MEEFKTKRTVKICIMGCLLIWVHWIVSIVVAAIASEGYPSLFGAVNLILSLLMMPLYINIFEHFQIRFYYSNHRKLHILIL